MATSSAASSWSGVPWWRFGEAVVRFLRFAMDVPGRLLAFADHNHNSLQNAAECQIHVGGS